MAWSAARWFREASERAPLERQIGLDVEVRGRGALVAEPQSDDGEIDASLEQMHRGRVVQRVQGDGLPLEGRARGGGGRDGGSEAVRDPGAGQGTAGPVGEHRGVGLAGDAWEPRGERFIGMASTRWSVATIIRSAGPRLAGCVPA